ncbi:uncharacterized protein V1516DRAFT_603893, partial [Lipomyces oligophaga]|uniref:uncharacterized protein n=1 Tax=Lipomyces oligophaga TaxID=45792 RepID=UPI0034CE6F16
LDIAVLIPLTNSHFNFCRSLYSALINDYPAPTLINFGKQFPSPQLGRVFKISGIADYLHQKLKPSQYALILDGYDVWAQLPFSTLRNVLVDENSPVNRSVALFGADKKCWPNAFSSPACTNVPESTLPKDAFGADTDDDSVLRPNRQRYIHMRPRWLNSGTIIGPVSVLRDIYDQANDTISKANIEDIFSDQMYIADIYGEQKLPMIVDFTNSVFQTMTFSHADISFVPDDLMLPPHRRHPGDRRLYAYNTISESLPSLLHFNGPKEHMDTWWPKMWWSRLRNHPAVIEKSTYIYQHGGAYDQDGSFHTWYDLCEDIDVHNPATGKKINP